MHAQALSSLAPGSRRSPLLRRRSCTRRVTSGAALVEAILITSVLLVMLVGVVYVDRVYERQLQVVRVSHAAALTLAGAGCEGEGSHGLAPDDAQLLADASGVDAEQGDPIAETQKHLENGRQLDAKTKNALAQASGATSAGLPKQARTRAQATARGPSSASGLGAGFQTEAQAADVVLCNDRVRDGRLEAVVSAAVQFFFP